MREARMPLPMLGLLAATRGMLGVGIGLLISKRVAKDRRVVIGSALVAIGALSTIPFAVTILRRSNVARANNTVRPTTPAPTIETTAPLP